jgi:ribose 5-phosphate isomerase B
VSLRLDVVTRLRALGHTVTEIGPAEGERCDYPDHAATVGRAVSAGTSDLGVLVCGTGIGVSIAANKIPGVRAALVHDVTTAKFAAQHNNANVLCLGGRLLAPQLALELVDAWLATPFETRHQHRLDKITALERPPTGG